MRVFHNSPLNYYGKWHFIVFSNTLLIDLGDKLLMINSKDLDIA
jgi:hypothetical protein